MGASRSRHESRKTSTSRCPHLASNLRFSTNNSVESCGGRATTLVGSAFPDSAAIREGMQPGTNSSDFPTSQGSRELLARRRICVDPQGYSKASQLSQYFRRELRAAIKAGGKVTAPNVNVVAFPVFLKGFGIRLERLQKRSKSGF